MTLEKTPAAPSRFGKYELLKERAGTGVGSTWIARSAETNGDGSALYSALRVHKHVTRKVEAAEAFVADVKPSLGLRHGNALVLVDAGVIDGEAYAVSELHDGEALSSLIAA